MKKWFLGFLCGIACVVLCGAIQNPREKFPTQQDKVKEFYYFRGQVDGKNDQWRIELIPGTKGYQWKGGEPHFHVSYKNFMDNLGN